MAATGYTPSILFNSVTTGNTPSSLVQGETAWNITDKKLWVGNASGTPIQLIGAGASMTLATLTTANDASISGLIVGKGGGSVADNTVFGNSALSSANGATNYSTAIGGNALKNTTTGSNLTAIGYGALTNNGGDLNVAVGVNALTANTSGSNNTALGVQSLQANTTASNNTAVGYQAGYSNTTGTNLVAVGYQSGYNNTTGAENSYFGSLSGGTNTTGSYNASFGFNALNLNSTGTSNAAFGHASLYNNTGSYNTAVGRQALVSNTTASYNTAVGYQAGYSNTTGTNNTCIGIQAGYNITTGGNNIYLGVNPVASSASVSNEININTVASAGKGANTGFIQPNGGGVYQGNNSTLWSITSDARLKKNIVDNTVGLSAINAIQVRNFEYRTADEVTDLPKESAIDIKGVQIGAIAQELALVLPDCVKTESTGVMSVDASNITWHLINAVKELSAEVSALKAKLGA